MPPHARRTGLALALLLLLRHGWAAPGGVVVEVTPARQSRLGSDDVTVVVTIRNTATAPRYVPAWQTPIAGVQAPLFDVTRDGLPVRYVGILPKRAAPAAPDFITLAPGAARSSRVELSALYRMDVTGAYSVRYRADRLQVYARQDTARPTGTDSKGGTLMHELSHFTVVAGTDDWAYGQDAAGALAGSDPARAVDNADSHEYFGENDPRRALR